MTPANRLDAAISALVTLALLAVPVCACGLVGAWALVSRVR
jgi:hypothetical protein